MLHIIASILPLNSVSGILAFSLVPNSSGKNWAYSEDTPWCRPECVLKCCFYVPSDITVTNISKKHKTEQVYLQAENGLCVCSVIRATFFTKASPNKYGTTAAENITIEWLSRIREALGSILDPHTCYPGRSVA